MNKYLGSWIENLNSDQLDISIFTGKVLLENLKLKKDVLQILGIPLEIKYGAIGRIYAKVPLASIVSTKTLQIEIEDVYAFVTPSHPSTWSESITRENLLKQKQFSLEKFDTMQDSSAEEVTAPGFLERWVMGIVENIQLSVKNVYIRFEDDITSNLSYSIGVILESLVAETCNSDWEPKNTVETASCYKKILLNNLSVFCDHDAEIIILEKTYSDEISKSFPLLASRELGYSITHNYILMPFSSSAQVIISKIISTNYPILNAKVDTNSIILNCHTQQVKSLMNLLEFFNLFNIFTAGVVKFMKERDFEANELDIYSQYYKDWLIAQKNNNTKKMEKKKNLMMEIESKIQLEFILAAREKVNYELNRQNFIYKKLEEIAKKNRMEKGYFNKINIFFNTMSASENIKKENEDNQKIAELENDLKNLLDYKVKTLENSVDWLKMIIMISIADVSISFLHNNDMLALTTLNKINLVLGLKDYFFVDFQISSVRIKNYYKSSESFPDLFESSNFEVYIQENPIKIKVSCGDIYIYCLIEPIFYILSVVKELLETHIDISRYRDQLKVKYNEYLVGGQEYIQMLISKGKFLFIDLEINLKAPVIIIPTTSSSDSSFLAIDLGSVICSTSKSSGDYEEYYLELKNFTVSIVWQWSIIKDWKNAFKLDLIEPISSTGVLKIIADMKNPEISLFIVLNQINSVVNPIALRFISDLRNKIIELLPSITPVQLVDDPSEQIYRITQKFKSVEKTIPIIIKVIAHTFTLNINDMNDKLCGIEIYDTRIHIESLDITKISLKIDKVLIKDLRSRSSYTDILYNPYTDNKYLQVTLYIDLDSRKNITDITVTISDLRIIACDSFIFSLMRFFKNNIETLYPYQTKSIISDKGSYYIESKDYIRVNIFVPNVEAWVASDNGIIEVSLSVLVVYTKKCYFKTIYSVYDLPVHNHQYSSHQELQLTATHITGKLLDSYSSFKKDLFRPFRASLTFDSEVDDKTTIPVLSLNLIVEALILQVDLGDIMFLYSLMLIWKDLPKFAPDSEQSLKTLKMKIEASLVKVVLSDETSENFLNLIDLKLEKTQIACIIDQDTQNLISELNLSINYYNARHSGWEPVLERWALISSLIYHDNEFSIFLESKQILNLNFSYELARVLKHILKGFQKNPLESQEKADLFVQNIEYVLENQLSFPILVWADELDKKFVSENSFYIFSEADINEARPHFFKKVKRSSLNEAIKFPKSLKFCFSEDKGEVFDLLLEGEVVRVLDLRYEGTVVPCLVQAFMMGFKRVIRLQTAVLVANSFDSPRWLQSVPMVDIKNLSNLEFQTSIGTIKINAPVLKTSTASVIVERYEYELTTEGKLSVIEINPLYTLKNSLVHDVSFCSQGAELQLLKQGESSNCNFDPTTPCSITIKTSSKSLKSPEFTLFPNKSPLQLGFEDEPKTSIKIKTIKNNINSYPGLSLIAHKKHSIDSKSFSWVIEIYTDYIFINKTQLNLNISKLTLLPFEPVYYSKAKKSMKAWIENAKDSKSKKFYIDTIGVSGMLKIPQNKKNQTNQTQENKESYRKNERVEIALKYHNIGLVITQPPGYLINTKFVTFVPRLVIWNHTDSAIFLRQHIPNTVTVTIQVAKKSFIDPSSTICNLDNYEVSQTIVISTDEVNWSGPFSIENLEDFQVRFSSSMSEAELELNVFEREWYIPSDSNNYFRYLRVFIDSEDGATIHVSFLYPNIPDFKIINKTPYSLSIKQAGCTNSIVVDRYRSVEWAWDNYLVPKKKVEIGYEGNIKLYSLEKVKEYHKNINGCSVAVLINGTTRELWIKSQDYIETQAKNLSSDKSNYLILKDGTEDIVTNPRYATKKSLIPMPELVNSMNSKFLNLITKEIKLNISLKISEIGLDVLNKDHKEIFYIKIKKLHIQTNSTIFALESMQKLHTNLFLNISHFQIDTISTDPNIFPVLISPITRTKDLNDLSDTNPEKDSKKMSFLIIELEHTMIIHKTEENTTDSIHQIENFEIALQEINISINEETIYTIINLVEFKDLLDINTNQQIQNLLYNRISNPNASNIIQSKSYFRFLKLRAVEIVINIKQSSAGVACSAFSDTALFNFARVLVGAFASISQSPLKFKEVYVLNAFQSVDNLAMALAKSYLKQGLLQFYKLIGCIDLLGNPLNLISKVGTGVYEFFAEPAKGLIGGPKSFTKGLGKGVNSLVSGIVTGSFDSISKISGTLYDFLKKSTGDQITPKFFSTSIGKNMLAGLGEGFKDLFNGFAHLFIKPYNGVLSKGAKGFFKGLLMGTVGLISSPFKFVLKISYVLSTTVSSTTILIFKGKLQTFGRSRFPRYISPNRLVQTYDPELASVKALFDTLAEYNKHEILYCAQTVIHRNRLGFGTKSAVFIVTPRFFLYLVDGDVLKAIKIFDIKFLEVHLLENSFFLCIATDTFEFCMPSTELWTVSGIYNIIKSINQSILLTDHIFQRPDLTKIQKLL